MDTTGDGQMDTLLVDVSVDEMGDVSVSDIHEVEGAHVVTEEGDTISLTDFEPTYTVEPSEGNNTMTDPDDGITLDNPDVDPLASNITDPDIPIDNHMNMDDFA